MSRITISLDKEVEQNLKELRKMLSERSGKEVSTSKTINLLLIAGMLSADRLHVVEWSKIRDFFDGRCPDLSKFNLEEFVPNATALRQWV